MYNNCSLKTSIVIQRDNRPENQIRPRSARSAGASTSGWVQKLIPYNIQRKFRVNEVAETLFFWNALIEQLTNELYYLGEPVSP